MLIELKNITKSFPSGDNDIVVLDGINLSIDKGVSISIAGPSGSGKSTLLNIIGLLDKPDLGDIYFENKLVNDLPEKKTSLLRNRFIGTIFQSHYLLPQLNLLENVLLPTITENYEIKRKNAVKRAKGLLEMVGLSDHISKFPGQLSGGECQRTAVVRSLINNPQIILADEPTGSLDEENSENVGNLLKSLVNEFDIAVIVATHSASLASKFDKNLNLKSGKLL